MSKPAIPPTSPDGDDERFAVRRDTAHVVRVATDARVLTYCGHSWPRSEGLVETYAQRPVDASPCESCPNTQHYPKADE